MSDENLPKEKAYVAIQTGNLPSCRPKSMWGGPGTGACCSICGQLVTHEETEFELEFAPDDPACGVDIHHVHVRCFVTWESERGR